MVCFVHDRHFLSKFHGYINQLRQSKEFTTNTLRQLPKLCCSCPEKRNNIDHTQTEPLLTSLDINALQLVALRLDLKRCINTNIVLSSSTFSNYAILLFPISFQAAEQAILADQFISQHGHEIASLQQLYHVRLEFVTPLTSKELRNEIAQMKYDLAVESPNYFEASRVNSGLWVIISTEDPSYLDIVTHVLKKKWHRFLNNIDIDSLYTLLIQQQNRHPTVGSSRYMNLRERKNKYQQMLKQQQQRRWQMRQSKQMLQGTASSTKYSDEDDVDVEDFVEDIFETIPKQLQFLSTRSDNCKDFKQTRTHRRQHILALALVA